MTSHTRDHASKHNVSGEDDIHSYIDHGSIQGLGDDDHPQYLTVSLGTIITTTATYKGITIELENASGANMVFGDAVYLTSASKIALIDADAIATMPCIGIVVNTSAVSNGSNATVLIKGQICTTDWNWGTIGAYIYGSLTATSGISAGVSGTLTQTKPTGNDDVIQIIGIALSADTILVNPQYVTFVATV